MAIFSPTNHDAIVVGISILVTCAVFVTMRQMLIYSRDSAIIPQSENKPKYITQEVEDSLKLSTLEKLLDSASLVIRDSATTIICDRALHNETTFTAILRCVSRAEYDTREKGIRALNLMLSSFNIGFLHNPQGYVALIKCLEYCVTDYEHNAFDPHWDNWYFRDIVEQLALSLLRKLVEKFGPGRLLKYHFIEQWLAKEPWGISVSKRQINFALFLKENNQRLYEIVNPIYQDPVGLKQLREAGLIPEKSTSNNEWEKDQEGLEGGQNTRTMFPLGHGLRRPQRYVEEYIRRRHREAMVLNDGSRPLGREDIIQRER